MSEFTKEPASGSSVGLCDIGREVVGELHQFFPLGWDLYCTCAGS